MKPLPTSNAPAHVPSCSQNVPFVAAFKRDALVQPNSVAPSGSESQKRLARQIHEGQFWPERKKTILQNAAARQSEVMTELPDTMSADQL